MTPRLPLLVPALVLTLLAHGCAGAAPPRVVAPVSTAPSLPSTSTPAPAPARPPTPAPVPPAIHTPAPPPTTEPAQPPPPPAAAPTAEAGAAVVRTGADVLAAEGFARLAGLRVGLVANRTSTSAGRSMVDLLHEAPDVSLVAVFAPEHGVRGEAGAGEGVGDTIDPVTGVPIFSLYDPGSDFAPTAAELAGIDVLLYDLQDVGARFYTYISTMSRCMAAAAAAGVAVWILDRPNPSGGDVVEGFLRTPGQASFISEHPIPARYGLTAGELAVLIAREGYVAAPGLELTVVPLTGWSREQRWDDTGLEWIPPSPGLPTAMSALVYPGTVLIEATTLSFGRGTTAPFTQIGAPWLDAAAVVAELNRRGLPGVAFDATTFVPQVIPGMAEDPAAIPFLGEDVNAVAIRVTDPRAYRAVEVGVHILEVLRTTSAAQGRGEIIDRPATFDLLAGTPTLRQLLQRGAGAADVVAAWQSDVATFEATRAPHLLY